jgi:O-antigen ligase
VSAERIAFWLVVASLGVVQFNLLTAQVLFGLAALLWVSVTARERRRPSLPAWFTPLLVYAGLTLVSAALSIDPAESFVDCKQLVLFLMVPIVARMARGDRATTTVDVIMALGAAGALVGIVQAMLLGYDDLNNRPRGLLSHYMTYSGVLMLVTGAAAARLLFDARQIIWPAIAVPALLVALALTQTRNAWIGAGVALTCLLGARSRRLLIAVPVLIALVLIVGPSSIRHRALSTFDPNDPSNRDRVQMLAMGREMVRDHPFFGVGPEMVQRVYSQYLRPDPVHTYNPHLHNVPMQIAAERGLPALAVWIWFVIAAVRDLWRQLMRGPARAIAGAGLAAVAAMLAAGLFEYNFGDSEFLMLFLGLITLPYAAGRTEADGSAGFSRPGGLKPAPPAMS